MFFLTPYAVRKVARQAVRAKIIRLNNPFRNTKRKKAIKVWTVLHRVIDLPKITLRNSTLSFRESNYERRRPIGEVTFNSHMRQFFGSISASFGFGFSIRARWALFYGFTSVRFNRYIHDWARITRKDTACPPKWFTLSSIRPSHCG